VRLSTVPDRERYDGRMSRLPTLLSTAEHEAMSEGEIAALATGSPLQRALFPAFADGDLTPFFAALEVAFFPMNIGEYFREYARSTLRIAQIHGPFRLEGIARAAGRMGPPISDDPFPALVVGGDGAGTDFVLLLKTGRVATLHHDATYDEVAHTVRRGCVYKHERISWFARRAATLYIHDLVQFQVRAHETGLDNLPASKQRKAAGALLGELHSLGYGKDATARLKHNSLEFVRSRYRPIAAGVKQGMANRVSTVAPGAYPGSMEQALRRPEAALSVDITRKRELADLPRLVNLQRVHFRKTVSLRALPDELFGCAQLIGLSITQNKLESLDGVGVLSNLDQFIVTGNALTSVPEEVASLTRLRSFHVGANPIGELPDAISQLPQLEMLDVGASPIERIPVSFAALRRLATLYVSSTGIPQSGRAAVRTLLPNADVWFDMFPNRRV